MAQMSESRDVPNMGRRQFMNLLLWYRDGNSSGALYPVVKFFIPPLVVAPVGE